MFLIMIPGLKPCRQLSEDLMQQEFQPHDGSETSLDEFTQEGGPEAICTHLPEPLHSESGETSIYYHFLDTPG